MAENAAKTLPFPNRIVIDFIPPAAQRYDTAGDYGTAPDGSWWFKISYLARPEYGVAVLIHELAEKCLCARDGVEDEEIDRYDMAYDGDGEPGDELDAPYYHQHQAATKVERQIIDAFGLDWGTYDRSFDDYYGGPGD